MLLSAWVREAVAGEKSCLLDMAWLLRSELMAVATCSRLPEDQANQHFSMDGRGAHKAPSLTEELLETDGG